MPELKPTELGFAPDEDQQKAIKSCCNSDKRIVSIDGEAGTGKTSIMKAVYCAFEDAGFKPVMTAPTGKAAKRIEEATGIPAQTNHRLLEYPKPGEIDPKTGRALSNSLPKRNRNNPLEYDVVLADEYRMVSHEVHRNIISALPSGGLVRTFGDVNQLPPIEKLSMFKGVPSPFEALIKDFESISLTTLHRHSKNVGEEEHMGITNAHRILQGFQPKVGLGFSRKVTNEPVDALIEYILEAEDNDKSFRSLDRQIITPTNKSWVGTYKLNSVLQDYLNPNGGTKFKLDRHSWDNKQPVQIMMHDKIIWTENSYPLEIFNGEVGHVVDIDHEAGLIAIDFGDRVTSVPPWMEMELDGKPVEYFPHRRINLAYALTTHKTQGSEYDEIIYVLNKSSGFVQNRANYYTAYTRHKNHVHLITDQKSLVSSLQKKSFIQRKGKR